MCWLSETVRMTCPWFRLPMSELEWRGKRDFRFKHPLKSRFIHSIQAVMACDFAIARFRFLKKLLLVHGHWSYDRLSLAFLYFLYKNTVVSCIKLIEDQIWLLEQCVHIVLLPILWLLLRSVYYGCSIFSTLSYSFHKVPGFYRMFQHNFPTFFGIKFRLKTRFYSPEWGIHENVWLHSLSYYCMPWAYRRQTPFLGLAAEKLQIFIFWFLTKFGMKNIIFRILFWFRIWKPLWIVSV